MYYLLNYVNLSKNSCRYRFANVDAKISVFLLNFQIISELFSRKICFIISVSPFSLECGCKSNAIKHNLQTFSALFFKFFLMAQQSLLLMYAHDKGTIFICTDVDNIWMGMEIGFKFQGFTNPFSSHTHKYI